MATTKKKTKLEIKSWDEKPYRELPDGSKFTRADVVLAGGDNGVELEATWEALLYYDPQGNSTYSGLMHATGTVDGHEGTFVMHGTGTYDGTSARIDSTVVPGSGTGGLADLTGTAKHVSTHADYPFWPMAFTFELP
jgi:Protein of unknown function (DUF3224)